MPQARRAPEPQPEPQPAVLPSGVREGSRWIGNPPTGEEIAKWFRDNVKLHDELKDTHDQWVGGLVLIPGTEKAKRVNAQGNTFELHRLLHTPYVKVETRVAYFQAYVRALNEQLDETMSNAPQYVGEILPVRPLGKQPDGLPEGFFRYSVTEGPEKVVNFIGCTMRVRVRRIDVRSGREGYVVLEGAPATKLIAVLAKGYNNTFYADPFATMKAETGAIGRALGMAGMLVIPGSGVATAEDMHEIATAQGGAINPEEVEIAAAASADDGRAVADDADIRGKIADLAGRLESESPDKFAEFEAWAKERKLPAIGELKEHQLRGVLRQLERRLAELSE